MVVLLRPVVPVAPLLGALVAFRVTYYLIPFGLWLAMLSGSELFRGRARVAELTKRTGRAGQVVGRWLAGILPTTLGAAAFVAGMVLLVSGVTPEIHSRIFWLERMVPHGLVELSHFIGSLAGGGLIVIGWALARRLDAAYRLAQGLLVAGVAASLLKGFDWEEATLLAVVFVVLIPARRHFNRRAALTAEPLSVGWLLAMVSVLGFTTWLGYFAHRHVEYSTELWWRFTARGDAPRALRATVGVLASMAIFGLARLFRVARVGNQLPTEAELDKVAGIVAEADLAMSNLALLGDKSILFSENGRGLLMYRVCGRSWVSMGDPVGGLEERRELAWRFRELAHRHGGWSVFYEVTEDNLPLYLDLGLTLRKLGEEAVVRLDTFSLEGGHRRRLRQTHRDVQKANPVFAVELPEQVAALLPELREVSDAWLESKRTREKSFSLGRFDELYLPRFPIATVRVAGRLVAFANLWPAPAGGELSIDLMRYRPDAPTGVMAYLIIEMMRWGRDKGYRRFNLGMAPFTGFESRPAAPWWGRLGAFISRHGESLYHFQGLRSYKEKFDPEWQPRYLASPSGLALPGVLADITRLVSGGVIGIVRK